MNRKHLTPLFGGLLAFAVLVMPGFSHAGKRRAITSDPVIIDTGNGIGGFSVTVTTAAPVLLSASAYTSQVDYRIRTFQVTNTSYNVWFTTSPSGAYGEGGGWYVAGSTGSYTTRSQAAIYGILDSAAGSGSAIIKGPYEYEVGQTLNR